ncbi:MAG: hypothetical protein KDE22_07400, partial [Rhodobacterales bacterium]|nr:hypothetical protein [Rhodobacterales bacterium]
LGVNMWRGVSRAWVDALLPRLSTHVASPAQRDLARRLLLTAATAPRGQGEPGGLLAERLRLLAELGDLDGAARLLDAAPAQLRRSHLNRVEADLRLRSGDLPRFCALVANRVEGDADAFWQKGLVFCQAQAGRHDQAALGAALLRELGDDDPAFHLLLRALRDKTVDLNGLVPATPLHLAMLRAADVALPDSLMASGDPAHLAAVAGHAALSSDRRLDAAERAFAAGTLDAGGLAGAYAATAFTAEERASPVTRAEEEGGPLARALLYHAARAETVPTAKAEAMATALEMARADGRYGAAAAAFGGLLRTLSATDSLAWFAPVAARALIVSGDPAAAADWVLVLRRTAPGDPDLEQARQALAPLARVAGAGDPGDWDWDALADRLAGESAERMAERTAGGTGDGPVIVPQASLSRLLTLFAALDETPPERLWIRSLADDGGRAAAPLHPALWARLRDLARPSRRGVAPVAAVPVLTGEQAATPVTALPETLSGAVPVAIDVLPPPQGAVAATAADATEGRGDAALAALVALGAGGPAQAGPVVLDTVLRALASAGLEADARRLAVEAAVSAGL